MISYLDRKNTTNINGRRKCGGKLDTKNVCLSTSVEYEYFFFFVSYFQNNECRTKVASDHLNIQTGTMKVFNSKILLVLKLKCRFILTCQKFTL